MNHVRPWSTVQSVLDNSDAGIADADNAHLHGVAVKTVRRWRRDYQSRGLPRGQGHLQSQCPRCEAGDLDIRSYAELLGWYLGDGHLTAQRRQVFGLHVVNDNRYPQSILDIASLMTGVKPGSRPHTRQVSGATVVTVSWKHWPCLFPQHGPGRKHLRRIKLEPWQLEAVRAYPDAFLRGLFHSDGARVNNWTTRKVGGELRRYDYPRWQFSNRSADIRDLCVWALDLVAVPWTRSSSVHISVNTRAGVASLDALIGLKQ